MRARELTEYSMFDQREIFNKQWEDSRDVIKWLKDRKFKFIGAGSFSSVWARDGYNSVIKVSTSRNGDRCWNTYVKWVERHGRAPKNLPKIEWIKHYSTPDENFFICAIEKLEKLKSEHWDQANILDVMFLLTTSKTSLVAAASISDDRLEEIAGIIGFDLPPRHEWAGSSEEKRYLNLYMMEDLEKYVRKNQGPFYRTSKIVDRLAAAHDCNSDLHSGNIMWRPSTKTIVFSDPLFAWN